MNAFSLAAHLTAFLVLAVLTLRLWRNLHFLSRVQRFAASANAPLPSVSVLIPARNEAQTIVACVTSLTEQNYPHIEIIALNDQSADATAALLDDLAACYPCLRVLHGTERPPVGWNGKSYACQRLAQAASGDWLLFTDADTRHSPTSIAQGIAQAQALKVDLLSVFPYQVTESWSERIMVSFILDFLPLIGLDLSGLWRGQTASTAANGQYLLIRASAYRAIGGHQAVASALVDDFALAKFARAKGFKMALVNGTAMLQCRMYRHAHEVWEGFTKNILLALQAPPQERRSRAWALAFAWAYACLFVLPFCHLLFAGQRPLACLEIGWLAVLRGSVTWQFARSWREVLSTPLAAWGVMALGLNALLRRWHSKPIRWKGREYLP